MTREEAANELQSYADSSWGELNKAFELAIAALREHGTRKPCKWCEDMDKVYEIVCYLPHDNGSATDIPLRFCPMCGRRLEEV